MDQKEFEALLLSQKGALREVNLSDFYKRYGGISSYYHNRSTDLRGAALVVWAAYKGYDCKPKPEQVGLERGYSYSAALKGPVYLLVGLSLELMLKAVACILGRPILKTHNLIKLCNEIGIKPNRDEDIMLRWLSEAIVWSGKYPTPKDEQRYKSYKELELQLFVKTKSDVDPRFETFIPHPGRRINQSNYQRLWGFFNDRYWQAKEHISEP